MMRIINRVALLAPVLAFAACLSPTSTQCPSGVICPAGMHCAKSQPICIVGGCGDGVVDEGEVCDDGNNVSGDGCSADCKSNESCGNGIVDTAAGEVCDNGADLNKCMGCAPDCKSKQVCGDGVIDKCKGEVCDDGANNAPSAGACPTQKCSADCKSDLTCGNGIADTCKGELCDKGAQNGQPGVPCSIDCSSFNQCGDGVLDVGEQCDPGIASETDGGTTTTPDGGLVTTDTATCTHLCKISFCGDGYTNMAAGETCDTGGMGETAGCNANCTMTSCGDGIVNAHAGEQCDNLGGGDTAGCVGDSSSARALGVQCRASKCGDKYINMAASETCDDGGESAACNANCTQTSCGDGIVNKTAGEQCDVVGGMDTAGCNGSGGGNAKCHISSCGDGYTNMLAGEQCDTLGGASTASCIGNTAPAQFRCKMSSCGDGFINAPFEACDDGNMNSGDGCSSGCAFETGFNCSTVNGRTVCSPICGDGLKVGTEACDDFNANACGSCSADCTMAYPAAKASGTITATLAANLRDGETFTISDGADEFTFEFIVSSTGTFRAPGADHVAVDVNTTDLAAAVASAITNAITTTHTTAIFDVTATLNGTQVQLQNTNIGSFGNVPIGRTVASTQFVTTGMSGGAGQDCAVGVGCSTSTDCATLECDLSTHQCKAATCSDGVKNGSETDLDCGGNCATKCANGSGCLIGSDCVSLSCSMGGTCLAPTCTDGIKNGTETDTDCGGVTCDGQGHLCADGLKCSSGGDCTSGLCDATNHVCDTTDTLTINHTGGGTVSTNPLGITGGISCGPACTTASDRYKQNTSVSITATNGGGWVFSSWSGDCSGSTSPCMVTMSTARTVTATFAATVTVTTPSSNATGGSVGTAPALFMPSIDCPSTNCTASYAIGTMVTLQATDGAGMHTFASWSTTPAGGPCDGSTVNSCTFTVNGPVTINGNFN